jgi:hypothetical protein
MKNLISVVLLLCIVVNTNSDTNTNNEVLIQEKEISVDLNQVFLSNPIEITGNRDFIVWVERKSLKFLDKDGNLEFQYRNEGRGPGKILNISDVYVDGSEVYIYDNSLKKVVRLTIGEQKIKHQSDVVVKVPNNRNFTVNNDKNLIFLHTHNPRRKQSSISIFDSLGNRKSEYGNVPFRAGLGSGLRGGGVTTTKERIFYTYLGTPDLYSLNTTNGNVTKHEDLPSYFTEAEEEIVKKKIRNFRELIRYAFTVSRVRHLFSHNGYIVQVVEDGGVAMDGELANYLEIWKGEEKIESKVLINSNYVFSDGEYIYAVAGNDSDLLSKKGKVKLFFKYKLNLQ